jgi:hypothetical protein
MTSGMPDPSFDFAHQNLRNCSFKSRQLQNANFYGADIRGCDFSCAQLQGANFGQVKAGWTVQKLIFPILVTLVPLWFTVDATIHMTFGAMGISIQEPNWVYSLALLTSSGIAGIATGIWSFSHHRQLKAIAIVLTGAASGALFSFYYGGLLAEKNPTVAVLAAVLGGVLFAIASLFIKNHKFRILLAIAGTVAGYGFAFMIGAIAIQFLSVYQWGWGLTLSVISLVCLRITLNSLLLVLRLIQLAAGTSFRKANLTAAQFEDAVLHHTDFSGAIGFSNHSH